MEELELALAGRHVEVVGTREQPCGGIEVAACVGTAPRMLQPLGCAARERHVGIAHVRPQPVGLFEMVSEQLFELGNPVAGNGLDAAGE